MSDAETREGRLLQVLPDGTAKECLSKVQTKSGNSKDDAEKKTDVNSVSDEGVGDFHRKVDYQISDKTKKRFCSL